MDQANLNFIAACASPEESTAMESLQALFKNQDATPYLSMGTAKEMLEMAFANRHTKCNLNSYFLKRNLPKLLSILNSLKILLIKL